MALKIFIKYVVVALTTFFVASAAAAATDLRLRVYPNPFAAGRVKAAVAYYLPAAGTVSLYIYDVEGDLVRTLVEDRPRERGAHDGEESWDGRNDGNAFVAAGPYVIVLKARLQGDEQRDTFVVIVTK